MLLKNMLENFYQRGGGGGAKPNDGGGGGSAYDGGGGGSAERGGGGGSAERGAGGGGAAGAAGGGGGAVFSFARATAAAAFAEAVSASAAFITRGVYARRSLAIRLTPLFFATLGGGFATRGLHVPVGFSSDGKGRIGRSSFSFLCMRPKR